MLAYVGVLSISGELVQLAFISSIDASQARLPLQLTLYGFSLCDLPYRIPMALWFDISPIIHRTDIRDQYLRALIALYNEYASILSSRRLRISVKASLVDSHFFDPTSSAFLKSSILTCIVE